MEQLAQVGDAARAVATTAKLAGAAVGIVKMLNAVQAGAAAEAGSAAQSLSLLAINSSGSALLLGVAAAGFMLTRYERKHGIFKGWATDRVEDLWDEPTDYKQRRALVRRWRQSLGLEEAETWAAMGASGLGPGLRSLAPSTFNPRLERALVACGGGGPTVTRTVLVWLHQEAGWRPLYAHLDPDMERGVGVPIEIVNELEVGSIPCANLQLSIVGREFVSSAHVLQPPTRAQLRAQARAEAAAEGRELAPAELASRTSELADEAWRMIVIPLRIIAALMRQGVSVSLG